MTKRCGVAARAAVALVAGIAAATLAFAGGKSSGFNRFVRAIDSHVESFAAFQIPDPKTRQGVLEDYRRIKQLRQQMQDTGVIPEDPLVVRMEEGYNLLRLEADSVRLLVSDGPLESGVITFRKAEGVAGALTLIDGNSGFWSDEDPASKFVSAVFSLPAEDAVLVITSGSIGYQNGAAIHVAKMAADLETWAVRGRGGVNRQSGTRCWCTIVCEAEDLPAVKSSRGLDCCILGDAEECTAQCAQVAQRNSVTLQATCTIVKAECREDDTCRPKL